MAVTLKDVAERAGFSVNSVSAVLNGKAEKYRISQATQVLIQKAAAELGYDPEANTSARRLVARKNGIKVLNNVIAVCSNPNPRPLHRQPFESEILDGIESVADKQGMDVLMCRLRTGKRLPRLLERGEVDGIITVSSRSQLSSILNDLCLPIVHLGSRMPGVHSVRSDNWRGISLITSHLIQLGHQKIAYIGHDTGCSSAESVLLDTAQGRFWAYCEEMSKANLAVEYVEHSLKESFMEMGKYAFQQLWGRSKGQLTAVVCYNDMLAMGVIQAAKELGLFVPHDLSVTGFDAVSADFQFSPFITSVGYDRRLMGEYAMEILMQHRLGGDHKQRYIEKKLPVYFVAGETTATPRKVRY